MEEATRLLPIVELDGSEYFVDVKKRQLRNIENSDNIVEMHSVHGKEIVRSMVGTEWRMYGVDRATKT